MDKRAVTFIETPELFISVELKRRPELSGLPVVIGTSADPASRGAVVVAASPEARTSGVAPGMLLSKAGRMLPGAVFLAADYDAYESASDAVLEIIREYTTSVESYGPGSAFMELKATQGRDPAADAVEAARELAGALKARLGVDASAGVGPNKLVAMAACRVKGKGKGAGAGGVVSAVGGDSAASFLWDLPIGRLPGLDARVASRLKELGARTIGELSRMPLRHLEVNFGSVAARILFDHARGIDANPVVPFFDPGAIFREVPFEDSTGDMTMVREALYALAEDVASRLKASGERCSSVSIKVGFAELETVVTSCPLDPPSDSMNDIWGAVRSLADELKLTGRVRLAGVMASMLERWRAAR